MNLESHSSLKKPRVEIVNSIIKEQVEDEEAPDTVLGMVQHGVGHGS